MRVLQVHNQHHSRGGADDVLDHEAVLLSSAGHQVERYVLPSADRAGGSAMKQGIQAIWNTAACRAVTELAERFDPDVFHVHTPFPLLSPAIFKVAARLGKPSVTTAHSFRYSCIAGTCLRDGEICEACVGRRWKLPGVRHRCYHSSVAASAALTLGLGVHHLLGTFQHDVGRVVTLTEFARDLLLRDGFAVEQVVVKPNSISDPGFAAPREGPPSYAVFVGRFVEEKGIRTLLAAWRTVGDRLSLRLAGNGPLRSLVEQETRENPAVEYVGWLDEPALNELIAGSEFLIVPSEWYEAGEPLVLLRALGVGRPVVVSDLENICSTVRRSEAGLTFRTGDASALAAAVRQGLHRLDDLRSMGKRGRAAYEAEFTPGRNLERLEQIYRSVLPPS